MAVEITMRQEAPAFKALENNEFSKALMKPVPFFEVRFVLGFGCKEMLKESGVGPNDHSDT
jgi:hypothetical protein